MIKANELRALKELSQQVTYDELYKRISNRLQEEAGRDAQTRSVTFDVTKYSHCVRKRITAVLEDHGYSASCKDWRNETTLTVCW